MLLRFLGYVVGMDYSLALCFWIFNFQQPLEESKKKSIITTRGLGLNLKRKKLGKEIKKYRAEISEKKER